MWLFLRILNYFPSTEDVDWHWFFFSPSARTWASCIQGRVSADPEFSCSSSFSVSSHKTFFVFIVIFLSDTSHGLELLGKVYKFITLWFLRVFLFWLSLVLGLFEFILTFHTSTQKALSFDFPIFLNLHKQYKVTINSTFCLPFCPKTIFDKGKIQNQNPSWLGHDMLRKVYMSGLTSGGPWKE